MNMLLLQVVYTNSAVDKSDVSTIKYLLRIIIGIAVCIME